MIFYCDLQGNLKAFQNETVYQGSNNVTTIYVVAPFSRPVGLNISFTKPNKLVTSPAIMKWVGTLGNVKIPVSFVNIPEQFTDTYNVWAYALPYSITEQNGVVGVSVNAVIADSVDASGQQAYKGNLTTFTGQFTVAYSALPSPPTDIPTEWTQDKVLDLLNNYYNDAIQKIGEMNTLKTDAKDTLVKAINEVFDEIASTNATIGDLSTLTTDEKTTIVGAINEVDEHADANKAEIGNLNALTTDEKATLVGAINEVDNHADNATTTANNAVATANSAVATANEAKTTAQTAENNANSAVDKADSAIDRANKAYEKAANNVYAVGFMTLQEAITAVNGYDNTVLKTNDNILVVAQGSPDLYVTSVEATNIPYNFTTVDKFNDDLVKNTVLQIGYYKVAFYETDGQPVTVAYQNVVVKSTDWVASTEFADFPYEAKIPLSNFVDYKTVPQVVFDIADTMSGNYAPICKSGDKCVYIYGKVQNEITLKTVITFAPNVNGASVTGGGYNNRGKWVASTTYAIDDLVYTDNGQFVCIEGITSTTSPEQDTTHWQATFVATGKTKNGLTISGQDNGTQVQKTFNGSTPVEVSFDETTMTTKEVDGVLKVGAKGTIPEALPQTAGALKSGSLPTSGWITPEEGWTEMTLPADSMWWSVIYGNGKFVAVARDSTNGAYSTDGITWTEMLMPASRDWKSVTYGNDKFVAVASGIANGAYSTDGINWTEMTLPASQSWISVTYGDGKYVAVASSTSDKGAYSTDGINWTTMSMPTSQSWQSVTYGDGKFVAVAYNSKKGAYSTDGITWTEMTLPAGHNWRITYGNDKFVAVAVDWQDGAYSTDGITWTKMFLPESKFWSSVTYGDGKFVAVSSDSNKVAYSTDGINWTGMSMPVGHNGVSVAYGDGKFVAVNSGANGVYWNVAAKQVTYVISDASVTANSDVLMELTDDGRVKASALTNGSIEVVRDTVPTQPIPYTYKVKQTNASGQFTLVNHYVPNIPVTSVNGQTGAVTIAVPTKTSELTNDSGFVKASEANTFTGVQTFSNADGIKTDRVHNLDNNDAWYNFDGSNNRFGSPSRPTIIRTSEARPRAQVPSGETTVTKEIALLEDVQGSEWAVNNDNSVFPKNGWYLISSMVVGSYQLAPFIALVTSQNNKLVVVTQDLEGHDVTLAMTIGSDRKFADAIRVHTYTIANNAVTATSASLSITTLLTDGQFSFDYKLLY